VTHNPKVVGSNPAPATIKNRLGITIFDLSGFIVFRRKLYFGVYLSFIASKIIEQYLFEELIKERQQEYYDSLAVADKTADRTEFVEMMMKIIYDALIGLDNTDQVSDQVTDQVTDQVNPVAAPLRTRGTAIVVICLIE
jgi:hypothetical protein